MIIIVVKIESLSAKAFLLCWHVEEQEQEQEQKESCNHRKSDLEEHAQGANFLYPCPQVAWADSRSWASTCSHRSCVTS